MIHQGEVWWADLPEPLGSEPGFARPVVVVQSNRYNRSRIATIVCVVLTSSFNQAHAPGNVVLEPAVTGLVKTSVANVSQIVTVDRRALLERKGQLPADELDLVLAGFALVLGA